MQKKKIYLDNASTTPTDIRVVKAMQKYWNMDFANPSSIHSMGVAAKVAVQNARNIIAKSLNAHDREIVFTSGGTEANNLALFGVLNHLEAGLPKTWKSGFQVKKLHFITTEIEHSSILECFKEFERQGLSVSYLKVDENGLVNPKDLRKMIKPETALVSIGYANSEIGTIQPIKEIIKEIRHARKEFGRERIAMPYLHLDASAAMQYENMNVEELGVDLMTIDAQKIYGPKGMACLYVRDGVDIDPIIFGGGQENGKRSGTENVPAIVGFAKAVEINEKIKGKESARVKKLRDEFFDSVKKFVPNALVNSDLKNRLPNNINISIPGQDGEMMVLRLDEAGIICSASSACASGSGESGVVREIAEKSGASIKEIYARAKSTLRFSLGRDTKKEDIIYLLKKLAVICK